LTCIKASDSRLVDDSSMSVAQTSTVPIVPHSWWRDIVLPKEHGSWSLALEPLALGLLVAPSVPGFWISAAALAGFFARRPIKIAWRESRPERQRAARLISICAGLVVVGAILAAIITGGAKCLIWLLPTGIVGAVFLVFDLKNSGREEYAEIAGAAAFAGISGAMAFAAGWPFLPACALSFAMCGRAVPTVMFVRAYIRRCKTGDDRSVRALVAAACATAGAIILGWFGVMPIAAVVAIAALFCRAVICLKARGFRVRARVLGFQELVVGFAYLAVLALAWRQ
jgi:hypothetical protein